MISGFLKADVFAKDHIHVFDISEDRTKYFKLVGIIVNDNITQLVEACDIIIFAVKVCSLLFPKF